MEKVIYRTNPEDLFTVWDVYYCLVPPGSIITNQNGRKVEIKTKVLSHNGRHTICRDYGHVRALNDTSVRPAGAFGLRNATGIGQSGK